MWRNGFDSVLIRSWWCTLGQGHFKGAVWFPIGSRFSSSQLRHTPPRTVPRWVSIGNFHCLTKWFIFLEYHNSWRVRFSIQFRDGSLNESGKMTYFGPFWYRRFLLKLLDIYSARQCKGKLLACQRIYTDHQPNQMSKTLPIKRHVWRVFVSVCYCFRQNAMFMTKPNYKHLFLCEP